MADIQTLRQQADEIASEGHAGWGNTMLAVADALEAKDAEIAQLRNALADMLAGWRYIRAVHGDLYGVGWDRAQTKAENALRGEGE